MASLHLDKQQSIYVLTLINGDQENALNKDVLDEYISVLMKLKTIKITRA